jgi:hypothetical protein
MLQTELKATRTSNTTGQGPHTLVYVTIPTNCSGHFTVAIHGKMGTGPDKRISYTARGIVLRRGSLAPECHVTEQGYTGDVSHPVLGTPEFIIGDGLSTNLGALTVDFSGLQEYNISWVATISAEVVVL